EDVTAATVHYLDRLGVQKRAGQPTEPFSLSVGFMLPHQPFVARREDYERYFGKVPPPQNPEPFGDHLHPHIKRWRSACNIEEVSATEIERARAAYWALVYRMDVLIGQILNALRENDLEENTLVVYMSDHGEQVGEHGLWWKQTFYEDSAKVPAILAWPGHLPEGRRCDKVTSSLDLNATMIEALGCPALPHSRGRNLLPLLTDPDNTEWDNVAFSEFCQDAAGAGGPFPPEGIFQRMVRRDNFKLNYYHGQPCQLFDLNADPRELNDLAADPAHAETVAKLEAEILAGWDPDTIAARMEQLRSDARILSGWGKNVQPPDSIRWNLHPEMDYLDGEQM
ncbi:MAG: sulfatase-like hydrolase/transferase, partial [Candidatus Latescibacteria bacterium]|nr:sulfatase-like hydrolase/transferase [Candidatus Latescibacterota bacterium]